MGAEASVAAVPVRALAEILARHGLALVDILLTPQPFFVLGAVARELVRALKASPAVEARVRVAFGEICGAVRPHEARLALAFVTVLGAEVF